MLIKIIFYSIIEAASNIDTKIINLYVCWLTRKCYYFRRNASHMEFLTPRQQHPIRATVTLQFDNSEPFPITQDMHMYVYSEDPTISTVDPKTAIIR